MKITAPFTPAQVREITPPLCPKRNDGQHAHNLPPWRVLGYMSVTQEGIICPKCGHTILTAEVELTP
jgi:hypothetical protein